MSRTKLCLQETSCLTQLSIHITFCTPGLLLERLVVLLHLILSEFLIDSEIKNLKLISISKMESIF